MSCADTLTTITVTVAIFIESSMLAMIDRQMFSLICVFLKDVHHYGAFPKRRNSVLNFKKVSF